MPKMTGAQQASLMQLPIWRGEKKIELFVTVHTSVAASPRRHFGGNTRRGVSLSLSLSLTLSYSLTHSPAPARDASGEEE